MLFFLQSHYPETPMLLTMILAMASGLVTSIVLEAVILKAKDGFGWKTAFTTAFSMSFLSMLAMELAANITDLALTGGRVALGEPWFWGALAISLAAGFLVPLPYNYYMLRVHGRACH